MENKLLLNHFIKELMYNKVVDLMYYLIENEHANSFIKLLIVENLKWFWKIIKFNENKFNTIKLNC